MTHHLKQLEHAIEMLWRQGLALTPDAQHYIDSTFSNPSVRELEEILGDESNCERDSLLELIFFPDQTLQVQLEDLLESHDFGREDEEKLTRALTAKRLQTTLLFPAGRGSLPLAVPEWVIGHFISRLNISKKPDPALVDAIRRYVPQPYQTLCKVKLRNTRFIFTPNKISFLSLFLKKITAEPQQRAHSPSRRSGTAGLASEYKNQIKSPYGRRFPAACCRVLQFRIVLSAYDFLLSFFEELEDDADLYRALIQKKRFYFQNLQKAERFSAQLNSSNMETLLLQGVRMPYINTAEARRRIGLIDRICYAVFGRSDIPETGGSIDLGEFDRENGLEAVFNFLS